MDHNPSIICEDNVNYTKSKNIHTITIIPGNYEIEYLIQLINSVLKQLGLRMQIKQQNSYVNIYSESNNFSLMTDYQYYPNNILSIFGFENGMKCINGKDYTSTKSYDLRADKMISLYILNINKSKPFCKLNMTSRKVTSFCSQLSPPLKNVQLLDFEFRDSKNNPIYFAKKNVMLDIALKSFEQNISTIETESTDVVDTNDLYDQISALMSE